MDDRTTEEILDRRVQARLRTDRDYLFAEDAETQALAERKIELQEERALIARYARPTVAEQRRMEDLDTELEQVYADLRGERA